MQVLQVTLVQLLAKTCSYNFICTCRLDIHDQNDIFESVDCVVSDEVYIRLETTVRMEISA